MLRRLQRISRALLSKIDSTLGNFPTYRKLRGGKWKFVPNEKVSLVGRE